MNIHAKYKSAFLYPLLILLIVVNIEMDIFLPTIVEMSEYFDTSLGLIQWILGVNFIGIFLSAMIAGYLSDVYGRRPAILLGTILFLLGSLGCIYSTSFQGFLTYRFLQGLGAGFPATIAFAAVCDRYKPKQATEVIAVFNGVITSSTVCAPLLGSVIAITWGWRGNFVFIALASAVALLAVYFFVIETNNSIFSLKNENKTFLFMTKSIVLSKLFWLNASVASLLYGSIIFLLTNFSIVLQSYLGMSVKGYAFFQAIFMLSFVLSSIYCKHILKKRGILFTNRIARRALIIGGVLIWIVESFFHNPYNMLFALACFNFGAACLIAISATRVIQSFRYKGQASALIGCFRVLTAALFILASSFAKGISLTTLIIVLSAVIAICYVASRPSISGKDWRIGT